MGTQDVEGGGDGHILVALAPALDPGVRVQAVGQARPPQLVTEVLVRMLFGQVVAAWANSADHVQRQRLSVDGRSRAECV